MVTFRGRPGTPPNLAWQQGLSSPLLANRRGLSRAELYNAAWLEAAAVLATPASFAWQQALSIPLLVNRRGLRRADTTYNAAWLEAAAGGSAASNFLARTSGLDGTHTNAYIDLINGLVTDGVWTKLDALWIFATQDSTTALLNLVSATYNAISHGSPTFTADRGFTGTNASTTVYLDSGFTPSTAVSPNFTQNSAHLSTWALNNITSGFPAIGTINTPTPNESDIYVKFTDNNSYFRVNGAGATGFANATAIGHYIGTRPSSGGGVDAYKNGASVGNTAGASQSVSTRPVYLLANNLDGTANGSAHQIAMSSIGSNLSSTDATNFYNRLRTFMTAVGVP